VKEDEKKKEKAEENEEKRSRTEGGDAISDSGEVIGNVLVAVLLLELTNGA